LLAVPVHERSKSTWTCRKADIQLVVCSSDVPKVGMGIVILHKGWEHKGSKVLRWQIPGDWNCL
jgi:hypothetical protein